MNWEIYLIGLAVIFGGIKMYKKSKQYKAAELDILSFCVSGLGGLLILIGTKV